jgi:hypothetical protein
MEQDLHLLRRPLIKYLYGFMPKGFQMQKKRRTALMLSFGTLVLTSASVVFSGCSGSSNNNSSQPGQAQTLYDKYGGAPTIQKVVSDAGAALLADCVENPFFTTTINFDNVDVDGNGHGANGHDTLDRLESCLVSQFTAAFGGPSSYSGSATVTGVPSLANPSQTYNCEDMTTAHTGLGIPPAVFDQFITDVGSVLASNGVQEQDITTVATALMGFKPNIVAPVAQQVNYDYQPGQPTTPAGVACTIAAPSPSPSPSVSPSPSPSASASI